MRKWSEEHDEAIRKERARLQDIVSTLPAPLTNARAMVVEGNAPEQILATIAAEQIDLVVIGSHTKAPLVSTLLGSTAEAVLNHATCSVLVVPHQERP